MAELKIDGMGNLIGQRKDNQQGPKLLFMAHLDETGFMVESITPDGFLKVIPLGGSQTRSSMLNAGQFQHPKDLC